jgi:hypothetical protein
MSQQISTQTSGKETAVETAMGALCVAANVALPLVVMGVYLGSPAWQWCCDAVLMSLVLVNLWLVFRGKRILEKRGVRHSRSIRAIAVWLVIGSVFNVGAVTPWAAWRMSELKAWNQMNHRKMAFEHAALVANDFWDNKEVYPSNLKMLLYTDSKDWKLAWYFPEATGEEVRELEVLADSLKMREATAAEAELIERAAHVKYVGHGLDERDQKEDYLVLISTWEVEGKTLLGYSTGRVDGVPRGAVAGIVEKENVRRAARGLPAIVWGP